jgi:hypothetical protein
MSAGPEAAVAYDTEAVRQKGFEAGPNRRDTLASLVSGLMFRR